jgi:hypothetical protein
MEDCAPVVKQRRDHQQLWQIASLGTVAKVEDQDMGTEYQAWEE